MLQLFKSVSLLKDKKDNSLVAESRKHKLVKRTMGLKPIGNCVYNTENPAFLL